MINDLVNSAQDVCASAPVTNGLHFERKQLQVVAMTGDCMGDLVSPADCAADIASFTEPWPHLFEVNMAVWQLRPWS